MSTLQFNRAAETLILLDSEDTIVNTFPAANFVDSHSRGPWPTGTFSLGTYYPQQADGVNGEYGAHGIFVFDVPGRSGMGVHSGRANIADGLGRVGFKHCTMGCIRTTDDAVAAIATLHAADPLTHITVS